MFSIHSSRKLVNSALVVFASFISIWLVIKLHRTILLSIMTDHIIIPERHEMRTAIDFDKFTTLEEYYVQQHHARNKLAEPNEYLISQLSQCRETPNPNTNHIRFPALEILNISMVPSDDFAPEFTSHKYFNPAMIPLPSHVYTTLGYRYLLVSRLVTTGHHQESHICFADICRPESYSSHNTRPCTASDLDWLGPQGGLRCITKPAKVNIPPTPSRRCTGAWSTFPDIPGFHDPRVFWSGRGAPLIEVNSGSQYGCVGLWLQDVRAVYPLLEDVLNKREKGLMMRDMADDIGASDGKQTVLDLVALGASISYPRLTEITKNPRSSRSEVEKNWVLFFPTEEETWVQYDMMGKTGFDGERYREKLPVSIIRETSQIQAFETITSIPESAAETMGEHIEETDPAEAEIKAEKLSSPDHDTNLATPPSTATGIDLQDMKIEPELKEVLFEAGPAKREEVQDDNLIFEEDTLATSPQIKALATPQSTTAPKISNSPISMMLNASTMSSSSAVDEPSAPELTLPTVTEEQLGSGGRSLAQLLSHGHTTPNLTSPLEQPCFDLKSHAHLHDQFNNTGHWHQGSNSLRLVFCTREQFRARSCIPTTDDEAKTEASMNWEQYERLLVNEGLVIHFSIVHRKFNNDWDLPMRYERYFLVWEARKPFRILGVSQYPVLFGNERARPWTVEENLVLEPKDDSPEQEKRRFAEEGINMMLADQSVAEAENETAYFTYTPSIAWAWRPNSDEGATQGRGHEDLGTGYLGEDIIIGIGMDDVAQGFVKVNIDKVLTCLRLCPF